MCCGGVRRRRSRAAAPRILEIGGGTGRHLVPPARHFAVETGGKYFWVSRVWRELVRDRTRSFNFNVHLDTSRPDRHATRTSVPPPPRPTPRAAPPADRLSQDDSEGGMKDILGFARARREHRPIVMVTAYDAAMARIVTASEVDAILVGDSAAMVVHGLPSTIHATVDMMVLHTAAVRRGAPEVVVIADLPFLAVRRGRAAALDAAGALLQAGATAVKVEGVAGHEDELVHLVGSGIPVMGHLGLTPQSVNQLGGYRLQGKSAATAARLLADARRLEELGTFALVLECIPAALAVEVTMALGIPTIGIGAGAGTSGQILVLTDLLGLDPEFRPRFVRCYLDGHGAVLAAVNAFARDVRAARFPAALEVPA